LIEPGVKVNGANYRDNLLAKKLQYCQAYIPKIPGFGVVFQQDGALAHRARDTVAFQKQKVPDFVSPTVWSPNSPDLNPNDYSIWSVGLMRE